MTLWERDYSRESNAVQIEEEFNPDLLILLVFGHGNINLPGQVINLDTVQSLAVIPAKAGIQDEFKWISILNVITLGTGCRGDS